MNRLSKSQSTALDFEAGAAGRAGDGQLVQKTQMRLMRMLRVRRRQHGDDPAAIAQNFRHPGQKRLEFEIVLPAVAEENGLGLLPDALHPMQKIFRAGTMQRARVKTVHRPRQPRRPRQRLAAHDRESVLAKGFHQFAAAGAKMEHRAVGGVQPGFIMADDGFARIGLVRWLETILPGVVEKIGGQRQ